MSVTNLPRRLRPLVAAVALAAASFASGGSAAAATWTTHGPYGGIADQIVVDPTTTATLYEASRGGGVFKSVDRGGHWTRASKGLTEPLVYTLVIDPKTPRILYAAGGNGVFRSIDGAASWTQASFLVNVRQLAIDPKKPTTLYAVVSQNSLFKSTDSGTTWTSQFNQLPSQSLYCIAIDPVHPNNVYVGAQGGVWRTTDAGAHWTLVSNGLGSGFIAVQQLAINPLVPRILYAGTGGSLTQSTDAGLSYKALDGAPPSLTLLGLDPQVPRRLYGTVYPGVLYASSDGGVSWVKRPSVAAGFQGNVRTLTVDPTASAQLYAGTDHGVYASATGGGGWAEANQGLANTLVTSLALDPGTPTILYAGTEYGGLFKTTDAGTSWSRVYDDWIDKITSVQIDTKTPSTVYASSAFGNGVFKSTNAGKTWTNPLASTTVLALAVDRATPTTLFAGTGGGSSTVLRSLNSGKTWASVANGLPPAGSLQANSLSALAGTVLLTDESNGAYVSSNAGGTWAANDPQSSNAASRGGVASASDPILNFADGLVTGASLYLTGIKADPRTNALGYVLQRKIAHGLSPAAAAGTWKAWAAPSGVDASTCPPMAAIAANETTPSIFYAGGYCGVLKGTASGAHLAAFGTGLPVNQQVDALALTPDGKTVFAGVFGGGVYSLTP